MDTKAKINLREGTVELEGSEDFVKKYLDEFKGLLSKTPISQPPQNISFPPQIAPPKKQKAKQKSQKSAHKGVNIAPIPLDLKSGNPNLRTLFNQKKPSNNQEIVTLFVYYINKTLGNEEASPGHIVSCYNEVSAKKPLNIPQLFRDVTNLRGWLSSNGNGTVKVTIAGENLIEHDLPREQNANQSQNTTKE